VKITFIWEEIYKFCKDQKSEVSNPLHYICNSQKTTITCLIILRITTKPSYIKRHEKITEVNVAETLKEVQRAYLMPMWTLKLPKILLLE
jgi:hypothetical protein